MEFDEYEPMRPAEEYPRIPADGYSPPEPSPISPETPDTRETAEGEYIDPELVAAAHAAERLASAAEQALTGSGVHMYETVAGGETGAPTALGRVAFFKLPNSDANAEPVRLTITAFAGAVSASDAEGMTSDEAQEAAARFAGDRVVISRFDPKTLVLDSAECSLREDPSRPAFRYSSIAAQPASGELQGDFTQDALGVETTLTSDMPGYPAAELKYMRMMRSSLFLQLLAADLENQDLAIDTEAPRQLDSRPANTEHGEYRHIKLAPDDPDLSANLRIAKNTAPNFRRLFSEIRQAFPLAAGRPDSWRQ